MKLSEYINSLISKGICYFTLNESIQALNRSEIAMRAAIRRLKHKKELAQPAKGFYVIVPPEYRILGCRPAEHFITGLMEYLNIPYYVSLLSAAQYYGAAHQRPQQFQVIISEKRRAIICGRVKIVFITKKDAAKTPTQNLNISHGLLKISTPEATARDIVIYADKCGGIENASTVINDLVEKIDSKKLLKLVSQSKEITWVQRLGYLLELADEKEITKKLEKIIRNSIVHQRLLVPNNDINVIIDSYKSVDVTHESIKKLKEVMIKNNNSDNQSINKLLKFDVKNFYDNLVIDNKWKLIINKKLEKDE
jgi:predicted transcriptional regulator of viral defense system